MNEQTVLVLGAGASASYGFLLEKYLITKTCDQMKQISPEKRIMITTIALGIIFIMCRTKVCGLISLL